jgi:hypothetical protein
MGAHQYGSVDVLSDGSFERMLYYTLYRHKGAHHYVYVDVFSDCPVD